MIRHVFLFVVAAYSSQATVGMADTPIILKGQIGCANWTAERAIDYAGPLEQLVIGYLDGLSRAMRVGFWKPDPPDQRKPVYEWLDTYCAQHATGTIFEGADLLIKNRTGKNP